MMLLILAMSTNTRAAESDWVPQVTLKEPFKVKMKYGEIELRKDAVFQVIETTKDSVYISNFEELVKIPKDKTDFEEKMKALDQDLIEKCERSKKICVGMPITMVTKKLGAISKINKNGDTLILTYEKYEDVPETTVFEISKRAEPVIVPGPIYIVNGYIVRYPQQSIGYVGETVRTTTTSTKKVKVSETNYKFKNGFLYE